MISQDRQEQKSKLEDFLVKRSVSELNENLLSIYSYGSSNESQDNFNDLDIMMILNNFPLDLQELQRMQTLTMSLKNRFDQESIPLDLHVYGYDEIPSSEKRGYSLLTGFFQIDYLINGRLLYGKDVLSAMPRIDIQEKSLDFLSRINRVIRQSLIDPNLSNTMAQALLGKGTLDVHREFEVDNANSFLSFLRYSSSIAAKCYLECAGEHYVSKKRNKERLKVHESSLSRRIDFVCSSKTNKDPSQEDIMNYATETLKIVNYIRNAIKGKD